MRWTVAASLLTCVACGAPRQERTGDAAMDPGASDSGMGDAAPASLDAFDDATADATLPIIPPEYECDVTQPGSVVVRTRTPNVDLLVHDVFGNLVARMTSGSTGTADVSVPGCGAVTAVQSSGGSPLLHTATYVGDGDELFLTAPPQFFAGDYVSKGPIRIYFDVPAPVAPPYYYFGTVSTAAVVGDPNARDVWWYDWDVDAQGLTTFAIHPWISGVFTIDNYAVFENVSPTDAMQSSLHITNWQTSTTTYQFHLKLSESLNVFDFGAGIWAHDQVYVRQSTSPAQVPALEHDFAIELSDYGAGLVAGAVFKGASTQRWRGWSTVIPKAAVTNFDLSDGLLPDITSLSVSPSSTRPTFSWTEAGGGVVADVAILRMLGPYDWRFGLPGGLTSYRVPELPADLAVNMTNANFAVSLYEASDYANYAAVRGRFIEHFVGGRKYPMGVIVRSSVSGIDAL